MKTSASITVQGGLVLKAHLLRVGTEVFAVYGDEECGFAVDPGDFAPAVPAGCRYFSLDELYFALVNLNASPEGQA
ncbi:MAG: hypothetical protein N3C12_05475 [Candidatus Binatia bacterium]|nr:hypothetical protein [Candidatus Binatia bacterium]